MQTPRNGCDKGILDESKFIELIASVAEIYGKELSPMAINLYYNILKNYSFEQIDQAFNYIVKTNKYNCMPKPAEVIESIDGLPDERSAIAWNQVVKAIRKYDSYQSVEFEDKTVHAVIDHLGGWLWLCDQTKEDLVFIAKDFMKLYVIFERRGGDCPERLIGFFESKNRETGFDGDVPKTVKIGDKFHIPFKKIEGEKSRKELKDKLGIIVPK